MSSHELTSPQLKLLSELDYLKLSKKKNINKQYPTKEYPQRSGNLETPAQKLSHRKMMGQNIDGKGTRADKPGRESSEKSVHPKETSLGSPTELISLGDPLERDITDSMVGDDANMHPSLKNNKPIRLQGPSETPGRQTYTSFGNRYPGTRHISF